MSLGDTIIIFNLEYNMIDTATQVFEIDYKEKNTLRNLKLKIIFTSIFYELYFKYRLTLINKSLIWKDPAQFDIKKHITSDFQSIELNKLISYAKNFNWIDDDEKNLINEVKILRNKYVHFSLGEFSLDMLDPIKPTIISHDFFDKHYQIIKKLLLAVENELLNSKDGSNWYKDLKQKFLIN